MSRTVSAAALRELLAQESGEVFLPLLTLSHPDITTLRVVANTVDITSRGNVYTAFPFDLTLPADATERLPTAQLRISNVDRRLVDEIRSVAGLIAVKLEIVTATTPDTVEIGPFDFEITHATYDVNNITGTLAFEPLLAEPYPADTFDPQHFPNLFTSA